MDEKRNHGKKSHRRKTSKQLYYERMKHRSDVGVFMFGAVMVIAVIYAIGVGTAKLLGLV
jgi:hypothetical protein